VRVGVPRDSSCRQGQTATKLRDYGIYAKLKVHILYLIWFGARGPSIDRDIRESSLGVYSIVGHLEIPCVSRVETLSNRTKTTSTQSKRYIYYIGFCLARVGQVLTEIFVKVVLEYT
jgi:hypothetical protein